MKPVLKMMICLLIWSPVMHRQAEAVTADEMVKTTGVSHGICSILGAKGSDLGLKLAQSGDFMVHVIGLNTEAVAMARKDVDQQGLYGKKIIVEKGTLNPLPYADNLIDLVIILNPAKDRVDDLSFAEIMRVLRPRGRAVLAGNESIQIMINDRLDRWLKSGTGGNAAQVEIDRDGGDGRVQLVKPIPPGIDNWSQWYHAPDNNPVSADELIKAPYITQWMGRPFHVALPNVTTTAGGRIFFAMGHIANHAREEPWLNTLLARNAYNGTHLWTRKLSENYMVHRSAFIATNDVFYLIDPDDGKGCLALNPETGEELQQIDPKEISGEWKWIAMSHGVLYGLAGGHPDRVETTRIRTSMPHWDWNALSRGYYEKRVPWGFGATLFAYDLEADRLRWVHQEDTPVDSRGMAMGGGKVFFHAPDRRVGCLDDLTGKVLWANDDSHVLKLINQRGHGIPHGNPGFRSSCFTLYTPQGLYFQAQSRQHLVALSVEDGHLMWNRERTSNSSNVIYTDNHLFVGIGPNAHTMKLDPSTGESIEDIGFAKGAFCTRLTATPDSFFQRGFSDGINRYDRLGGKTLNQYAPRPGCNDGVIGANGLLYVGPWLCDCAYTLIGRISLCSAGDFEFKQSATEIERLERADTDLSRVAPLPSGEQDWHAYRGGNRHDGSSPATVSLSVCPIWHTNSQFDYFPTVPVTAGGMVFLGGDDGKVRAYDTLSGSPVWQFPTAGPILQPPSIWEGRLYVGSGDGAVYCLEAVSGRLLWRFRAAPIERRIMVYGALSSTWPVNTGVLVHEGVAYAAAGIVDYDGTYVYALDAETGAIRWQNFSSGHLNSELRRGVSAQGNLALVDGKLWIGAGNTLGLAPFDPDTGTYVGPEVGDQRRIGGEEVGVFGEGFLLHGGRLRYAPVEPIVNGYRFKFFSQTQDGGISEKELTLSMITPAWDTRRLVYLTGQNTAVPGVPRAMDAARVKTHLKNPGEHPSADTLWEASALHTMEFKVLGLALARDAVLAIATKPQPRTRKNQGWLLALDRDDGAILWEERLQAEPRLGGLCIDRDGRILVSMAHGGLACFAGGAGLEAHVNRLVKISRENESNKPYTSHNLRSWIRESEHAADLNKIADALRELGDDPHQPEAEGYLNRWKLIGPFPYDEFENNLERPMVSEPAVDLEQIHDVNGRALRWKDRFGANQQGMVSIIGHYAEPPTAYYVHAEFTLQNPRPLQLKLGTNFESLLWWNGEPVHTAGKPESRRIAPGTTLPGLVGREGVNRILIKTIQPWWRNATFVGIQVLDPDGEPINLKIPPGTIENAK